MTEYVEGIYFGMQENEYHQIPYFSRSACETMIFDPSGEEYWHNSLMNPDYKRTESTAAMELGSALHCMLLEPERFERIYVKKPRVEDIADKIVFKKTDEIKHFLKSVGEKISGNKRDLIKRAERHLDSKTHVIWDNFITEFNQKVESNGQRLLSEDCIEILNGIRESLERKKNMPELLKNIYSEITIIWKDATGVMCKCRLDGARPEAIIEVKSFSVQNKKVLDKAIYDAINYQKYNLQYFVYRQALAEIIKKVKVNRAKVFGEIDPKWLAEFLKTPNKQFFIMFFRTQAPYQCKAIELRPNLATGGSLNVYYSEAHALWNLGIKAYKRCCDVFGTKRWVDCNDVIQLMDQNIPAIMFQSAGF